MAESTPRAESRLGFIDDARGIAVVLMVFWHTVDGWIRRDLQAAHPVVLDAMRVFGGTAAPMFVMLAGVGAAMKLIGDEARGKSPALSSLELGARGLHVVATGYALRVYMWMIDDRAILRVSALPATIPIVVGLGCTLVGLDRVAARRRAGVPLVLFGLTAWSFGVSQAFVLEAAKAPFLLKVDVLQAIGGALVFIALINPVLAIARRPWLAVLVGVLVALPTEAIGALMPGPFPPAIAAYLGRWDTPFGARVAAFPLFPWVGYACVGVAVGHVWIRYANEKRAEFGVLLVGCVGAAVGAVVNGPPFLRWVIPHYPFVYKATFMLHKIGFGIALVAVLSLLMNIAKRFPLRELGKTSMFIYWVHLEFAYGLAARSFRHRLGYGEWALGFVGLTLAMAALAHAKLRAPAWISALRKPDPKTTT